MSVVTCNKCQRTGLKWGKKTLNDGKVLNVLLEVDGTDHRVKSGDEYVCKKAGGIPPIQASTQNTIEQLTKFQQPQGKEHIVELFKARSIEAANAQLKDMMWRYLAVEHETDLESGYIIPVYILGKLGQ